MTLVEFLEARLAEDELTASAAIEGNPQWQALYSYRDIKDADGHYVVLADSRYPTAAQAAHIARHNPARALRQCAATRALIADFLRHDALGDLASRSATEQALRQLAAIHCDHPQFDHAWF
ncbi:MAG: hypothetical protein QOE58_503 [Actinomycetota bacterium]|jgi:hypothetical protein|nr:hypothetical protein [Actinomycetota bacterium]